MYHMSKSRLPKLTDFQRVTKKGSHEDMSEHLLPNWIINSAVITGTQNTNRSESGGLSTLCYVFSFCLSPVQIVFDFDSRVLTS